VDGLFVALMREARFLREPRAAGACLAGYERLVRALQPEARSART